MPWVDGRLAIEKPGMHRGASLVDDVADWQRWNGAVQLVLPEHMPSIWVEVAHVEVPHVLFKRLIREIAIALLASLADMLLDRGFVA